MGVGGGGGADLRGKRRGQDGSYIYVHVYMYPALVGELKYSV